jgi:hypothetical protein
LLLLSVLVGFHCNATLLLLPLVLLAAAGSALVKLLTLLLGTAVP